MQVGAEQLPRPAQVALGVVLGGVAAGWALNAVGWLLTLLLIAAWDGPRPLEIAAIAAVQVGTAVAGLPPMLRLALALQRPSHHRQPGDAAARRLAIAFAVALVANFALMLASAANR
jgi:hypothetical protein